MVWSRNSYQWHPKWKDDEWWHYWLGHIIDLLVMKQKLIFADVNNNWKLNHQWNFFCQGYILWKVLKSQHVSNWINWEYTWFAKNFIGKSLANFQNELFVHARKLQRMWLWPKHAFEPTSTMKWKWPIFNKSLQLCLSFVQIWR